MSDSRNKDLSGILKKMFKNVYMGSCPQFSLSYIIFEEKDGKVSFARMAGMAHLKTLSIYFPACLRGKIMDLLFSPNIVLLFSNFLKFVLVFLFNPSRLP